MDVFSYGLALSMLGSCCVVVALVVCVEGVCMRTCEAPRLARVPGLFDPPARELVLHGTPESKGEEYSDCESVTSF